MEDCESVFIDFLKVAWAANRREYASIQAMKPCDSCVVIRFIGLRGDVEIKTSEPEIADNLIDHPLWEMVLFPGHLVPSPSHDIPQNSWFCVGSIIFGFLLFRWPNLYGHIRCYTISVYRIISQDIPLHRIASPLLIVSPEVWSNAMSKSIWLVVWNMFGIFPFSVEFHSPSSQLTKSYFSEGLGSTTNQYIQYNVI